MKKIKLSQGLFALVDADDYDRINKFKWYASRGRYTFYAQRTFWLNGKRYVEKMHRFILCLNPGDGLKGDHKDGNGLNNQKCNLRKCTHAENSRNRGFNKNNKLKIKGVCASKNKNLKNSRWKAYIQLDGKTIYLGTYNSPKKAESAYLQTSLKYHGDYSIYQRLTA